MLRGRGFKGFGVLGR